MSDQRIQATEKLTGANHATLPDTLNRLSLVEHNIDGTHKSSFKPVTAGAADTAALATNAQNLQVDGAAYLAASITRGANKIPATNAAGWLDAWISTLAGQLFRVPAKIVKSAYTVQGCGWVMLDGTVRMCGYGLQGSLGLGVSVTDHYTPVAPGFPAMIGTTVSQLFMSGTSCYALMVNGDVYYWGPNAYGQGGQGNTSPVLVPTKIPGLSNVAKIFLSQADGTNYAYVTAFFLKTDGSVYSAGYNGVGQCGNGNTTNQLSVTQVLNLSLPVIDMAVGSVANTSVFAILNNGNSMSWGFNTYGTLGQNDTANRSTPAPVTALSNVAKIVCQGDNTYGSIITYWLLTSGALYAAGYNRIGELGLGNTVQKNVPTLISGITVADIAVGGGASPHTVALLTSGYIRTWGYGLYGELGMNNTTTYTTPQTPSIPGNPTISKIWAAGLLNCGVSFLQDSSGIIWSAGYNGYGQLGVGDVANKLIFTRVLGVAFPNAATVSDIQFCGYDSYLAVLFMLADGRCLGCGKNAIGMLGINPFGAYDSPVPTPVIF